LQREKEKEERKAATLRACEEAKLKHVEEKAEKQKAAAAKKGFMKIKKEIAKQQGKVNIPKSNTDEEKLK